MIRTSFYALMSMLFAISCVDPSSNSTDKLNTPAEPERIEVNENALSTRGATIGGSQDEEPAFFMEAITLSMQPEEANQTVDSLALVLKEDSSNIDASFALGTNSAMSCSFFYKEDDAKFCLEAIPLLSKVIDQEPSYKNGAAYFNRGQAYALAQQWDNAEQDINKYIEIDKEIPSAFAYYILAQVAYAQGDTTTACEHVQTAKNGLEGFGSSSLAIWSARCK